MNDIMIDLETMGNKSNAPIIAIGAVAFDKNGLGERFYMIVDLKSSVAAGGIIDPDTVLWWMKQSNDARAEFSRKGEQIGTALYAFRTFVNHVSDPKNVRIWGNGSDFDNVILGNAYDRLSIERPWQFWNNRCFRTIKNEHKDVEFEKSGTAHNALVDAENQAKHLVRIWNG